MDHAADRAFTQLQDLYVAIHRRTAKLGHNSLVFRLLAACVTGGVTTLVLVGCNSRLPVLDATAPTVPTSVVGPAPVPTSSLFSLTVEPSAVFAGGTASGRLLLTYPAPASGFAVALSTSDPAASVPASIVVPPGGTEAQFVVTTNASAAEVIATVSASASNRTFQAPLALWTKSPTFVASWADPGNGQRIVAQRVTQTGQWRANCYASVVSVGAANLQTPTIYAFLFGAPQGSQLTPGTYDNAQTIFTSPRSPSRPLLDILAPGFTSCSAPQVSRFNVSEVSLVADLLGTVRRFAVTFEQQCGTATIRGEASLVGVAPTNTSGDRCIVR